ncbi:hypothetical protein JW777_09995 [bacterium]|nr:hypothetical protein [bacterium]
MTGTAERNDVRIRRAIRLNRLVRRMQTVLRITSILLIFGLTGLSIAAAWRSWFNSHQWRLTVDGRSSLRVEQGRRLPWLEFEPAFPDLPALTGPELPETSMSSIFPFRTKLDRHLAAIYRDAARIPDRGMLSGASRAAALLEATNRLDPDAPVLDLASALSDLSDRFASEQGGENLVEAWRYLSRSRQLTEESASRGDPGTDRSGIERKLASLSRRIERKWFHRIGEHLLDGNDLAAQTIISELESCGFRHPRLAEFRKQLNAARGDIP